MHSHPTLSLDTDRDLTFTLSSQTETSSSNKNFITENLSRENPKLDNNSSLSLDPAIMIAPIFFSAMVGIILAQKLSHQLYSQNIEREAWCERCRFFSNNRYLKCAVQPSLVLTKEADACPDYYPQENKSIRYSRCYSHKR
jgi:hypothetical protein